MSDNTRIDWCDSTINPGGWGCFGPGGTEEKPNRCLPWCYAYRMAKRNLRPCKLCQEFVPHYHTEEWTKLYGWRRGRRVFVQSMGDLWGRGANPNMGDQLFYHACTLPQHTLITLTKEPARMRQWAEAVKAPFPPNLWLGVSITSDEDHDRAWQLLQTRAALRFISYEPMLGPLDLHRWELICKTWRRGATIGTYLDWVILGAATGPGSAKLAPKREWVESIVEQCRAEGVPVFEKSSLAKYLDRPLIQEFPEVGNGHAL